MRFFRHNETGQEEEEDETAFYDDKRLFRNDAEQLIAMTSASLNELDDYSFDSGPLYQHQRSLRFELNGQRPSLDMASAHFSLSRDNINRSGGGEVGEISRRKAKTHGERKHKDKEDLIDNSSDDEEEKNWKYYAVIPARKRNSNQLFSLISYHVFFIFSVLRKTLKNITSLFDFLLFHCFSFPHNCLVVIMGS